jgi:hypothetical protein
MEELAAKDVDPGTADIPAPDDRPDKPRRIKRKLKTKDVKRLMKTFGRVREMQAYKNQARYNVAAAEAKKLGIAIDDVAVEEPAFDFMTLLLTQATDDALSELNMLFADLCEIKPHVKAGASAWDIEEAINKQIEEEDIEFYTDVLDDLNDFGGLEGFLKALIRSIRSMDSVNPRSTSA